MKNLSTAYKSHISQNVTTLAKIVKIVRKDNTEYNYTDHDQPIIFSGDTYSPLNAFIPTDFQTSASLSVDNLDITGIVNETEGISESDINKKYFYNAEIYLSEIDYTDPDTTGQNKILYGTLGDLTLQEEKYIVEFRSLTFPLTRSLSNLFSKTCRVDFGSTKCGVIIDPPVWQSSTEYCKGAVVKASVYDGRRYEAQTIGNSGVTEPSWDTTINNTTTDNQITWVTKDSYVKKSHIYCPVKVRIVFYDTNGTGGTTFKIKEVRFFDENNTRVFASNVDGSQYFIGSLASNVNDDDTNTVWSIDNVSSAPLTFTFSNEFRLTKLNIEASALDSWCDAIKVLVSYDNETTWNEIFYNGSLGRVWWAQNSHFYEILNSELTTGLEAAIYTSSPFIDMNYIIDGRIIWTSGNNNNLSMEIVSYDTSTGLVNIFNPMPEKIRFNDSLDITVGCNHLYIGSDGTTATGHCESRFNNGINFQGEPFVPTEDILAGGIGETNKKAYST